MMEQDEDAMRMLRLQTDEIYRPLGAFDAQSNKGGIVGGEKHAGFYAMNDMFLRSVSPKSSLVNTKRNQISQSVMNRILVGTGDVDHMPQAEREIYDMMMGFLERTGINPAQAQTASALLTPAPAVQTAAQESDSESNPEADQLTQLDQSDPVAAMMMRVSIAERNAEAAQAQAAPAPAAQAAPKKKKWGQFWK